MSLAWLVQLCVAAAALCLCGLYCASPFFLRFFDDSEAIAGWVGGMTIWDCVRSPPNVLIGVRVLLQSDMVVCFGRQLVTTTNEWWCRGLCAGQG
jgi:hypothetical protein